MEDGIPPLVELLEYKARKVQLTAIRALRALAYNNVENVSKVLELIYLVNWSDEGFGYNCLPRVWNLITDCWTQCITQSCTDASIRGFYNTFHDGNMILLYNFTHVYFV